MGRDLFAEGEVTAADHARVWRKASDDLMKAAMEKVETPEAAMLVTANALLAETVSQAYSEIALEEAND